MSKNRFEFKERREFKHLGKALTFYKYFDKKKGKYVVHINKYKNNKKVDHERKEYEYVFWRTLKRKFSRFLGVDLNKAMVRKFRDSSGRKWRKKSKERIDNW